jgi:hypothetical protein
MSLLPIKGALEEPATAKKYEERVMQNGSGKTARQNGKAKRQQR